jgi:hypothetical protein
MTLWGIFVSRDSRMRSSLPESLVVAESLPLGRPRRLPSLFLRAKCYRYSGTTGPQAPVRGASGMPTHTPGEADLVQYACGDPVGHRRARARQ